MHAFVLDKERKPLNPCRMARARLLLKQGRAALFRRLNQLAPSRISNFAVEESLRQCPTVSDFIGFTYQEGGHLFYILTSAIKNWSSNTLPWKSAPTMARSAERAPSQATT